MRDRLAEFGSRLEAWGSFRVLRRLDGGYRNLVFLVADLAGALFVAKTTERGGASLAWAARLQAEARRAGIVVPQYRRAPNGCLGAGGLTLEPFIEGRQATQADLVRLRPALARLRAATAGWAQRPGFASAADLLTRQRGGDIDLSRMPADLAAACRAAWAPLVGRRETAIHGDLNSSNLLIDKAGRLVLLDWDEARRDSPLFDHCFAGTTPPPRLVRAWVAWEVASGWNKEPAYAHALAARLLGVG